MSKYCIMLLLGNKKIKIIIIIIIVISRSSSSRSGSCRLVIVVNSSSSYSSLFNYFAVVCLLNGCQWAICLVKRPTVITSLKSALLMASC